MFIAQCESNTNTIAPTKNKKIALKKKHLYIASINSNKKYSYTVLYKKKTAK
jgi:hypothetical protein